MEELVKELTNREKKMLLSLQSSHKRKKERLFIAEGPKLIQELMQKFRCHWLITTEDFFSNNKDSLRAEKITLLPSSYNFSTISLLQHPRPVIAVYEYPTQEKNISYSIEGLTLFLEDIQDPGNLGTIIRTCDWFGIKNIYATKGTVDCFSPKVIQASMGGIARVKVTYINDVEEFFQNMPNIPIYGAFLKGKNILGQIALTPPKNPSLLVMGNEGKGISVDVENFINEKITIPSYTNLDTHTESLNVAIAMSIILSRFFYN